MVERFTGLREESLPQAAKATEYFLYKGSVGGSQLLSADISSNQSKDHDYVS